MKKKRERTYTPADAMKYNRLKPATVPLKTKLFDPKKEKPITEKDLDPEDGEFAYMYADLRINGYRPQDFSGLNIDFKAMQERLKE